MPLALLLAAFALKATSADNYAVLVAGSSGYSNYRHQADVCHAYQILIRNGVPADNIITMSYDDVAGSSENPFPGKLFNKPTEEGTPGVDVYDGCVIDYKGSEVTPKNFIAVLKGDSSASGKVLKSGSNDKVFINFVDHGAPGLVAFPSGYLHADELNSALKYMNENNMYSELVFYLEACESGSMFDGLLPDNIKIYATTAANGKESSWGTYCPPSSKVDGKELNTCLGDLYSVNWMEDADRGNTTETLEGQYEIVKDETSKSHVMEYGAVSTMGSDLADGFWGALTAKAVKKTPPVSKEFLVDSRDVALQTFYSQYINADAMDIQSRNELADKLISEIQLRQFADTTFLNIAKTAMAENNGILENALNGHYAPKSFDCHRAAIQAYEQQCAVITDYALKHVGILVNLCEITKDTATVVKAVKATCA
uniref:legumain n=1 Tax=Lotharella oceanica TaxID=641309 RepID=A0A7S2TJG5_9EUKA